MNRDDFNTSTCTCPEYFNSYVCKHIIGLAHQKKVIRIPNEAKARGIERKAARGRPAKSHGAYKIQAPVVRPVELTEPAPLESVETAEPQTSKKAATTTRKRKQPATLEPVETAESQTSKKAATTTNKRKQPAILEPVEASEPQTTTRKRGRPPKKPASTNDPIEEPVLPDPVSSLLIIKKPAVNAKKSKK